MIYLTHDIEKNKSYLHFVKGLNIYNSFELFLKTSSKFLYVNKKENCLTVKEDFILKAELLSAAGFININYESKQVIIDNWVDSPVHSNIFYLVNNRIDLTPFFRFSKKLNMDQSMAYLNMLTEDHLFSVNAKLFYLAYVNDNAMTYTISSKIKTNFFSSKLIKQLKKFSKTYNSYTELTYFEYEGKSKIISIFCGDKLIPYDVYKDFFDPIFLFEEINLYEVSLKLGELTNYLKSFPAYFIVENGVTYFYEKTL